jgi:cytochrome b/b6/petB-like protein
VLGILMFVLGCLEGLFGYSLPDDLLSGAGLRITASLPLSVPVIGTWIHYLSLNAAVRAGRVGLLLVPPLAYCLTYRLCLALQHSDRAVLEHGIVKRLPHGAFVEVRQPLADLPLVYQGAAVRRR